MSRWPTGHVGWAFARREQFEGVVTSFLSEGAALGERLLLITDDPEPHLWPIELVDDGALLIMSTDEAYGADRIVHAATQRESFRAQLHEAQGLGYTGLRVAADNTSMALGPERLEAWLRWESEADDVMGSHAITGLCAFDRSRLDAATVDTLVGAHTAQLGA